jgi:hypothetical protein
MASLDPVQDAPLPTEQFNEVVESLIGTLNRILELPSHHDENTLKMCENLLKVAKEFTARVVAMAELCGHDVQGLFFYYEDGVLCFGGKHETNKYMRVSLYMILEIASTMNPQVPNPWYCGPINYTTLVNGDEYLKFTSMGMIERENRKAARATPRQ